METINDMLEKMLQDVNGNETAVLAYSNACHKYAIVVEGLYEIRHNCYVKGLCPCASCAHQYDFDMRKKKSEIREAVDFLYKARDSFVDVDLCFVKKIFVLLKKLRFSGATKIDAIDAIVDVLLLNKVVTEKSLRMDINSLRLNARG